jgi:hypothetical protein
VPGGLNGSFRLNGSTVQNDLVVDFLWGQGGTDWFFTHPSHPASLDLRQDFEAGELTTDL